MYFCLGLNTGFAYKLSAPTAPRQSGGGEGGSIYRCRPDGSKLERVATGFWNVHDLTFDAFGRLFAVDNDPDDRPPCRLLDIIEGGDYGYQFRNGRKGMHPFTSWNGELPGTLPMVAAIGEAPSGIVAYESNGLPDEYRGRLLVTTLGRPRHRALQAGAAKARPFTSAPETLVHGGEDFRPVGIATAPDGSLLRLSDWVDKSYPVHGKRPRLARSDEGPAEGRRGAAGQPRGRRSRSELVQLLSHPQREVRRGRGGGPGGQGSRRRGQVVEHRVRPRRNLRRARPAAAWALAEGRETAQINRAARVE